MIKDGKCPECGADTFRSLNWSTCTNKKCKWVDIQDGVEPERDKDSEANGLTKTRED